LRPFCEGVSTAIHAVRRRVQIQTYLVSFFKLLGTGLLIPILIFLKPFNCESLAVLEGETFKSRSLRGHSDFSEQPTEKVSRCS
jgi:hypothetical protein